MPLLQSGKPRINSEGRCTVYHYKTQQDRRIIFVSLAATIVSLACCQYYFPFSIQLPMLGEQPKRVRQAIGNPWFLLKAASDEWLVRHCIH